MTNAAAALPNSTNNTAHQDQSASTSPYRVSPTVDNVEDSTEGVISGVLALPSIKPVNADSPLREVGKESPTVNSAPVGDKMDTS